METKNRIFYEAPATTIMEVKNEGFLCASNRQARVSNYDWYDEGEE